MALTKEQAIKMFNDKWWMDKSPREICEFQLFEPKLCMEFSDFHKAVEQCLGRGVYTHEFAFIDNLQKEFRGNKSAPTEAEIIGLLPPEKTIVVKL